MSASFCWWIVQLHPGSSSPELMGMVGGENVGTEGAVTATLSTAPKEMLKEPQPQLYLLHLLQELQLDELLL